MSTGNFYQRDAKNIYAVENDEEDEYEYTRDSIINELDESKFNFSLDTSITLESDLRSFPSTTIGYLYETITFLNQEFDVNLIPLTCSGYYEGFNLDYEIRFEINGESFQTIEDLIECLVNYSEDYNLKRGIVAMNKKRLETKLQESLDSLTEFLEGLYEQYSTPLVKISSFSNGEAIYKEA